MVNLNGHEAGNGGNSQGPPTARRAFLYSDESLKVRSFDALYEDANPNESNRYSFRPRHASKMYYQWPSLQILAEQPPMLGLNENRGEALHDISREEIVRRMKAYYDPGVSTDALRDFHPGLVTNAASFDAEKTRARLQRESKFREENVRRFLFKPFDLRWAYIERLRNLWNRVRPELLSHASRPNEFILARRNVPKFPDGSTFFACTHLADQHALHTDAYFIPVSLSAQNEQPEPGTTRRMVFSASDDSSDSWNSNLSVESRSYLKKLGIENPDSDLKTAKLLFGCTCSPLAIHRLIWMRTRTEFVKTGQEFRSQSPRSYYSNQPLWENRLRIYWILTLP